MPMAAIYRAINAVVGARTGLRYHYPNREAVLTLAEAVETLARVNAGLLERIRALESRQRREAKAKSS